MELSTDHEFLAAAITAVTGDLFLSTIVPGPNTEIPPPYRADYLWNGLRTDTPQLEVEPCKLESISQKIQTWYCPKNQPGTEQMKENPLNIKTLLSGRMIQVFIDRSSFTYNLKEKIQDLEGIPIDQQRLVCGGKQMEDWQRISNYQIEDEQIHLVLKLGGPPSASLLGNDMFDSSKNVDFSWLQDDGQINKRGNYVYKIPYGWNKIALNVKDKYDDTNWLGADPGSYNFRLRGLKDEWPVAYHGRREMFYDLLHCEESIQGRKSKSRLEKGFYTTPDPLVAEESAPTFTFKSRKFKVMIQSRVNMNDTSMVRHKKFFVTENPENIRPCGLLIKNA